QLLIGLLSKEFVDQRRLAVADWVTKYAVTVHVGILTSTAVNVRQSRSRASPPTAVALQLAPALLQLPAIILCLLLDLARNRHQPGFTAIGAATIAAATFVISQVLIVSVPLGDAQGALRDVGIPADKHDRIF